MTEYRQFRRTEPAGLETLYRDHADWLGRRLRRHVASDQAADLVHETYVRIAPLAAEGVRHPKALLIKIAMNLLRDDKRRAAVRSAHAARERVSEATFADQAETLQLKAIVQSMPPLYRDVFMLSRFRGMSYADIARSKGLSVKGVGVVIPNLLAWPHSLVVLDIKRENYRATAGYRAQAGQRVLMFDPLARDGRTARFNPLGHIDRADPHETLDELQRMAAMLFTGHEQADPFWSEAARTGFIGVGAYVAATSALPFTLGEIFRQLTQDDPQSRLPRIVKARRDAGDPLPAACVSALTDFCAASDNTFASIRQSITTRLGLWLNPRVDAATSVSDFDLRDLRNGKTSLYLGASPDNLTRVAPLYALLFQQLVDLNSRALPHANDPPILVLLDEFARLGPAPVLAHAFSWVAGYGLRLLPVLQSPSQLHSLFGPHLADEILANCAIEIVFAPKAPKLAQELSERLGAHDQAARSRSGPRGLGLGRRTVTVSNQRRPLMLPQELMLMPSTELIILKASVPPVRGRKIVHYRERVFRRRLRPPPEVASAPMPPPSPSAPPAVAAPETDLDALVRGFTEEGLPPPDRGASEDAVRDWLDRVFHDRTAADDRPAP